MASIFFRKLLKTVCFDCEMTFFWQNLLKAVCFGQNAFCLNSCKNSRFCQNSSTYRYSVMVIFRFLGQNGLKLRTTYLCCTKNTYGTLKERYQVNLQEKINHNQNFSQFSETEAINLKKVASFFQDTIHFHPGHRQPKTLIFTIRALVE